MGPTCGLLPVSRINCKIHWQPVCCLTSLLRRSTRWLCTELPVITAFEFLLLCRMHPHNVTFSIPKSVLTGSGNPYWSSASLNKFKTVKDLLFADHRQYTINRIYPPMPTWTTNILWQSLLGTIKMSSVIWRWNHILSPHNGVDRSCPDDLWVFPAEA